MSKPKSDAYVGLLFMSLVSLVAASLLLYLDLSTLGTAPTALGR